MTPRRITVVASEILGVPGTGGPGTADSFLAIALGRHGYRVELLVAPGREIGQLSPEWQEIYAAANVRVRPLEYRLRVRPQISCGNSRVFDALRRDPPDVVIADDWRGLAYAALRSRQLSVGLADTAFVIYCHAPGRALDRVGPKGAGHARPVRRGCLRACLHRARRRRREPEPVAARLDARQPLARPGLGASHSLPVAIRRARRKRSPSTGGFEPAAPDVLGQLREGKGIRVFVASLRRLDPSLLQGVELVFLGRDAAVDSRADPGGPRTRGGGARVVDPLREQEDRSDALQELLLPGTLAVMPSLVDNSPYAVAECLEHGIPFVAARGWRRPGARARGGPRESSLSADSRRSRRRPDTSSFRANPPSHRLAPLVLAGHRSMPGSSFSKRFPPRLRGRHRGRRVSQSSPRETKAFAAHGDWRSRPNP